MLGQESQITLPLFDAIWFVGKPYILYHLLVQPLRYSDYILYGTLEDDMAQTVEEMKAWIDNASYEQLLAKWRNAPVGDPYFCTPEVYKHYVQVMREKKEQIGQEGHVAASKRIGWK